MRIHPLQLTAHKGLRAEILLALKRTQPLTAKQLAHQLGVSVNAIRHHLKELEAEDLFPRAYEETLTQLLQRVVEQGGRQAAVGLFEDHYRDLTHQLQAKLAGAAASERLDLVTRLMNEQGYMAEWQEAAGTFRLSEHNCAIRAVAERFPEVCAAEEQFLRDVLGAAVERRAHIASGCNACEYAITFTAAPPRESS